MNTTAEKMIFNDAGIGADGHPLPVDLKERLKRRIYDPAVTPAEPTPLFSLNQIPICTPGNLTTISAPPKAGKSAVIGAMMASTFAQPGADCLAFTSQNPSNWAVLHLDTEQSPFDHWQGVGRVLRRAKIDAWPSWLRSYGVAGFSAVDVRGSIRILLEQGAEECGGVHSLLIDGVADAAQNVNDPVEAMSLTTELHELAIDFNCAIISVIHVNPGSDFKTRGHLGSQLERKSETNLQLRRTVKESVIYADKNRRAPIPKESGPRFQWSDTHQMHISAQTIQNEKDYIEHKELTECFKKMFEDAPTKRFSQLQNAVTTHLTVSEKTSERKIKHAVTLNILKKTSEGAYQLSG